MADHVSVVIPHYGDPEPTLDLVAALRAQREVELQIIVSDDASPEPFPAATEHCLVVRRPTNGGFGAAVNSGAAVAEHELLLVLNSDITIDETFVRDLVAGARPWMPAVVGTVVFEDGFERCIGRNWPTALSNTLETLDPLARLHGVAWFERRIGNDVTSWHADEPQLVDWLIGVCLLMPLDDFRAVGGIDERYFMNCEEIDLQRRLHEERGLPVVLLPGPRIDHVGGGSSDDTRRSGWLTDARFRYHEKWDADPRLYLGLMASAYVNLAFNSARRLFGRDLDATGRFKTQRRSIQHGWRTRR